MKTKIILTILFTIILSYVKAQTFGVITETTQLTDISSFDTLKDDVMILGKDTIIIPRTSNETWSSITVNKGDSIEVINAKHKEDIISYQISIKRDNKTLTGWIWNGYVKVNEIYSQNIKDVLNEVKKDKFNDWFTRDRNPDAHDQYS